MSRLSVGLVCLLAMCACGQQASPNQPTDGNAQQTSASGCATVSPRVPGGGKGGWFVSLNENDIIFVFGRPAIYWEHTYVYPGLTSNCAASMVLYLIEFRNANPLPQAANCPPGFSHAASITQTINDSTTYTSGTFAASSAYCGNQTVPGKGTVYGWVIFRQVPLTTQDVSLQMQSDLNALSNPTP